MIDSTSPTLDFKSLPNPYKQQLVHHKLTIGPYRICPVPTGIFGLDGGAMFGTVPKVLWEKNIPADTLNRIPMEARALLLDGGPDNPRVLIDCGIGGDFIAKYGEKLGSKFAEMYAIDEQSPAIERGLKKWGLKVDDITHVILTHLHFDHAGGATQHREGRLQPTFPQAEYYVQGENLETARAPNLREKASYFAPNFDPLLKSGVLTVLDGAKEDLLPGVSVSMTNGHTRGQQTVRVSDTDQTILYCGDLIPTSSHVRLPWVMGYDLHPLLLIEEKREVLSEAAKNQWFLFFEHDPYMDAARIHESRNDFVVSERVLLD